MKRLIILCIVLAVSSLYVPAAGAASDPAALLEKVLQLKEKIAQQVEKVHYAREQADTQMTLARMRAADQLERAEENLSLQIEILDRMREQLQDMVADTNAAIDKLKVDRVVVLDKALMDIEEQTREVNGLIDQTRAMRESYENESCPNADLGSSAAPVAPPAPAPPTAPVSSTAPVSTETVQTSTETAPAADATETGTSGFQTDFFPMEPATAPPGGG